MNPARALAAVAAVAAAAATAAGVASGAAQAPPGDGPVREPIEAWSSDVDCEPAGRSERPCTLGLGNGSIYVFQHDLPDAAGSGRLRAIDPVTGVERWSVDTVAAERLTVSHEVLVLGDKGHVEVIDAETGTSNFTRPGRLVEVNDYGVVLVESPPDAAGARTIEAIDGSSGSTRWTVEPGLDVGAVCRDIVVLVPAVGATPQPFRVVEHHTGVTRWEGEEPFDPVSDMLRCSGAWLYTTNGDTLTEWDSVVGWLNWETPITGGAVAVELYRDVALVTGSADDTVTAVKRETGEIVWSQPADVLGTLVSARARLRRDEATVFVVSPMTGAVVDRIDLPDGGAAVRFVAASECRLVVAAGPVVVTYGVRDLAETWSLHLEDTPGDVGIESGTLVVRLDDRLVGYRSPADDVGMTAAGSSPPCTF